MPELNDDDVDYSIVGLTASDQVQRQPALNVSCSVEEVMGPPQGTNAIISRVSPANHSLAGWTAPWEV